MTLLVASEHDGIGMEFLNNFHAIAAEMKTLDVTFSKRGGSGIRTEPLDIDSAQTLLFGVPIELSPYLGKWADQVLNESTLKIRTERFAEGSYDLKADSRRDFGVGEFVLNGGDMDFGLIFVGFCLHVFRPKIVSRFDVQSRGREVSFAPFLLPRGESCRMRIVQSSEAHRADTV